MTRETPTIQSFALGPFLTNCAIVTPGEPAPGEPCWIVDCGFDPAPMLDAIDKQGLKPAAVVLTHAHCDHIAGVNELRTRFGPVPIWIHQEERAWLGDPALNLSQAFGLPVTCPQADGFLAEGEPIELAGQPWRVLHTPGHSPGSVSLVHDESRVVLAGDTLFDGSIGRYDFPGASLAVLTNSIRTKLYTLPDDTRVLPGHGAETTIGREKMSNPFVRADESIVG